MELKRYWHLHDTIESRDGEARAGKCNGYHERSRIGDMQDTSHDDMLDENIDENVIEIADLPGDDGTDQDHTSEATSTKRILLTRRTPPRQRRRQAALTTSILLGAILILLASSSSIRDLIGSKFFPTPPPLATPLVSGSDYFYFQVLPSWGTVSLDGRPLARVPMRSDEAPLRLPPGRHYIELRAAPFSPVRCTLVVPPVQGAQTCLTRSIALNGYGRSATLLSFPVEPSLGLLPSSQRQALIQAVQHLLDSLRSTEMVQPGERYAGNYTGAPGSIAKEPLQATLRFLLDTETATPAACQGIRFDHSCFIAGHDCRLFCTIEWPQDSAAPTRPRWDVVAIIRPTWEYTPTGKQGIEQGIMTKADQQFVAFRVSWEQGKWDVAFHPEGESSFDDPNCIVTMGTMLTNSAYRHTDQTQQQLSWTFFSGANRASGCVAATLQDNPTGSSLSITSSSALLLQRFGVLLAANEIAHQRWPTLPVANNEEQRLAQSIVSHPAFVS